MSMLSSFQHEKNITVSFANKAKQKLFNRTHLDISVFGLNASLKRFFLISPKHGQMVLIKKDLTSHRNPCFRTDITQVMNTSGNSCFSLLN